MEESQFEERFEEAWFEVRMLIHLLLSFKLSLTLLTSSVYHLQVQMDVIALYKVRAHQHVSQKIVKMVLSWNW